MQTSTEQGKRFEQQVADLMHVLGYFVEREQILGHKKIDLLVRQHRLGAQWTTAVECKDERRAIDKGRLLKIWADYEPLYRVGAIDELLLVSRAGLSASAQTLEKSIPGLKTTTYGSLLTSSLDFTLYLRTVQRLFVESPDGLSDYYISPKTSEGEDLEEIVSDWLEDRPHIDDRPDPSRPIAILGAYGIGKSSFATKLASQLATVAIDNPESRIPILLRLGELAGEQDLEGLLGKHFTATTEMPNFRFRAFMELNRLGRFVVFLDGFDEMKQMLTWREFAFNIRQINRLCTENSRVVLLGRPTAFETDAQQRAALHGERETKYGSTRDHDSPDYQELEIQPLQPAQVREFLEKYEAARKSARRYKSQDVVSLVESKQLRDIAKRPVQLRMLAEILPSYEGAIDKLNLVAVYELFIDDLIDRIIAREEEKRARLAFSKQQRRDFIRLVAWWLWRQRGASVATSDQIPEEIVLQFAPNDDAEAARRDLVVASPLDRRFGERIAFPHRSFQEFLVAEEAWNALLDGSTSLQTLDGLLNDEVAYFMRQLRGQREKAWGAERATLQRGCFSWRLVETVFSNDLVQSAVSKTLEARRPAVSDIGPWELLAFFIARRESVDNQSVVEYLPALASRNTDSGTYGLLVLFCLLLDDRRVNGSANASKASSSIINHTVQNMLTRGTVERFSSEQLERQQEKRGTGGKRGRRQVAQRRVAYVSERPAADLYIGGSPAILPINDEFVGDRRRGANRVGRYLGSGRLGVHWEKNRHLVHVDSAPYVEIRWLSGATMNLIRRLPSTRGPILDLRSLRQVFVDGLREYCFVHDWVDHKSLRSDVALIERAAFASDVLDELTLIRKALIDYEPPAGASSS